MKHVVIFFAARKYSDPLFNKQEYVDVYHMLAASIVKKGAACYIVRGQESYLGGVRFGNGWIYRDDTFQRYDDPITADVVYNKGDVFIAEPALRVINTGELNEVCRDKAKTYALFPELFPRTVTVHAADDIDAAFAALSSDQIVIKPLAHWGGQGVVIGSRDDLRGQLTQFPYLVQEYIDTSGGIPGITDGVHDLRLFVVNGEILFAFVRIPPSGSLVVHVATGAQIQSVLTSRVPDEARRLFEVVDAQFARFGTRIYSVDCARDVSGTWKIIECDPQPAILPCKTCANGTSKYFDALAAALVG